VAVAIATIAWSTLAVGGVYVWATVPIVALGVLLAILARPRVARRSDTRPLDVTLLVGLAALAFQLLPLPNRVRWLLSPRVDVDRMELLLMPDAATSWRPLSLDPHATGVALAVASAAVLVFWSCRSICGHGHTRPLVRAVAVVGLVAAVAAVVQRAVAPELIYGIWPPADAGARPFGPFVNRNHFATWLLMAVPLTAGALVASAGARRPSGRLSPEIAAGLRAIGSVDGWIGVSSAAMMLTLILTSSRSGLGAAAVTVVTAFGLSARRLSRRGLVVSIGAAALVAATAAWITSPQPILARVQETLSLGSAGRADIWQDATTVFKAYPWTGTGVGTFERSMLVYQATDRSVRTNQAHNQYLQVAAEGGLLLIVPILAVCAAFARLAWRRFFEDASPSGWLRIGSLAGLVGVAVQSVWETGLRMPGNLVLFAVVAAIAVHRPMGRRKETVVDLGRSA